MRSDHTEESRFERFLHWAEGEEADQGSEEAEDPERAEFVEYLEYIDSHDPMDFGAYRLCGCGSERQKGFLSLRYQAIMPSWNRERSERVVERGGTGQAH